jgi:hypothetical protein
VAHVTVGEAERESVRAHLWRAIDGVGQEAVVLRLFAVRDHRRTGLGEARERIAYRRLVESRERLAVPGRTVVELTEEQIREFAGNAVELCGRTPTGKRRYVMAMSARAKASLRPEQIAAIEESCEIVAVEIPTIELAGGSVRCMIAGVHLDRRAPIEEAELTEAVGAINEDNPITPDGRYVAKDYA